MNESIKHSVYAALIVLGLYGVLPTIGHVVTGRFGSEFIVLQLSNLIMLILIIGIIKKSRISAVTFALLFIFTIVSELVMGKIPKGGWAMLKIGILFYLFIGTLEIFAHHKKQKSIGDPKEDRIAP